MSATLTPPPPPFPTPPTTPVHIRRFRLGDIVLLTVGSGLFLGSLGIFASGLTLRTWIFGWPDDSRSEPVGSLRTLQGQVERKRNQQPEFERVASGRRIYNHDTIVTAPDGQTTLALDDGSEIELGPSTMVRIEFDQRLAMSGVKRNTVVEVVTGSVKGHGTDSTQSKFSVLSAGRTIAMTAQPIATPIEVPPVQPAKVISDLDHREPPKVKEMPPPAPLETHLAEQEAPIEAAHETSAAALPAAPTAPAAEAAPPSVVSTEPTRAEVVEPTPAGVSAQAAAPVHLTWVSPAAKGQMRLTAAQFGQLGQEGIFRVSLQWKSEGVVDAFKIHVLRDGQSLAEPRKVNAIPGQTEYAQDVRLSRPGNYAFEITPAQNGADLADSRIRSDIEFLADVPTAAVWTGESGRSLASNGPATGDALEWPKIPGAKNYLVEMYSDPKAKAPLAKQEVQETSFAVPPELTEKHEKIYYRVTASLGSGFSAPSPVRSQILILKGPVLTLPRDRATLTQEEISKAEGKIILTWQRTPSDKKYQLEVSQDPAFKTSVVLQSQNENFAVVKLSEKGRFFWRVSADRGGRTTAASSSAEFTIEP